MTEFIEDHISLTIETVETVPLDPNLKESLGAYPLSMLKKSGRQSTHSLRCLLLENPYLTVRLLPDLGGRISGIFDKRTQTEILPHSSSLYLSDSDYRGCRLNSGIEWVIGHRGRALSLGPVEYVYQDHDPESPAKLIFHELVPGENLDCYLSITLPPDRAEIQFDFKLQNRNAMPVATQLGLLNHFSGGNTQIEHSHTWIYDTIQKRGLAYFYNGFDISQITPHQETLELFAGSESQPLVLYPKQTITWSIVLTPLSGVNQIVKISRDAALATSETGLQVLAHEHKRDVRGKLTSQAGTFEASFELQPLSLTEINLDAIGEVTDFQLLHQEEVIFDFSSPHVESKLTSKPRSAILDASLDALLDHTSAESRVFRGIQEKNTELLGFGVHLPGWQSVVRQEFAKVALRAGELDSGLFWLEEAQNYLADDPQIWANKSTLKRHLNMSDEEDQDLPTAHFLSPLDPYLRAEGFLQQEVAQSREPSPIVKPLAKDPDAMIGVACQLLDHAFFGDAHRWIDECCRHQEIPMLRYLQAWALMKNTRMNTEASILIQQQESKKLEPPFPWRPVEIECLEALIQNFRSPRIERLLTLFRAACEVRE